MNNYIWIIVILAIIAWWSYDPAPKETYQSCIDAAVQGSSSVAMANLKMGQCIQKYSSKFKERLVHFDRSDPVIEEEIFSTIDLISSDIRKDGAISSADEIKYRCNGRCDLGLKLSNFSPYDIWGGEIVICNSDESIEECAESPERYGCSGYIKSGLTGYIDCKVPGIERMKNYRFWLQSIDAL